MVGLEGITVEERAPISLKPKYHVAFPKCEISLRQKSSRQ